MFWKHFFSGLLPGHCFSVYFYDFLDFGCQKWLQNVGAFLAVDTSKMTPSPKSSQRSPEPCPGAPKATKMEPKAPKMTARDTKMEVKWTQRTVPLRKNTWSLEAKSPVEKGTVAARRAANWIYIYIYIYMNDWKKQWVIVCSEIKSLRKPYGNPTTLQPFALQTPIGERPLDPSKEAKSPLSWPRHNPSPTKTLRQPYEKRYD